MSGKFYIGNSINKSVIPYKAYVGDSNNKAKSVKAIYYGDSLNKAVKVWPLLVPFEYQRVEYISNGNLARNPSEAARINTGVKPDPYTKVYAKFMLVSGLYLDYIFKSNMPIDSTYSMLFSFGLHQYNGGRYVDDYWAHINFYYKNYEYKGPNNSWDTDDTDHTGKIWELTFNDYGRFYLNNTLIYTATDYTGTTLEDPIRIFSRYSVTNTSGTTRIYGFKIWQNNTTLVRDFYPCYRKSDNINGLYDAVNGVFYTNEVTAHLEDIARGPEVN